MTELKRVLIGICSFSILLVIGDRVVGTWSEKMYQKSKYGIYHRQKYCMEEAEDELFILGSSRANHQYVSSIFEDILGLQTFNAGSEGQSVYYHYVMLQSIISRNHIPDLVILDIFGLDITKVNGASFSLDAAAERLSPHYFDNQEVRELFKYKGKFDEIKTVSKAFLYNSKLVQLIKCNYSPLQEDNGYEVINGKLADDIEFDTKQNDDIEIDSLKLAYFNRIIDTCKDSDIPLIVVFSPIYCNVKGKALDMISDICEENNVLFLDYSNEETMLDRSYFRDVMHLNDYGARIWSKFLAEDIKSLYFN